jgi:steroid delta-isomerase-like uncharacterized protein
MNVTSEIVTTRIIIDSELPELPSAPALLALARFHYSPGAKFGPALAPGPVAFRVERGQVQFSAEKPFFYTPVGSGRTEEVPPGKEITMRADDQFMVPALTIHSAHNQGTTAVSFFGAATFPLGPIPSDFPPGISFDPIVMTLSQRIVDPPGRYTVWRTSLPVGSQGLELSHAGPGLITVESGALTVLVTSGEVALLPAPGLPEGEVFVPGQLVEVNASVGLAIRAGTRMVLANDQAEPLSFLELKTASEVGRAVPGTADARKLILPQYVKSTLDDANPDAIDRFLAPDFVAHDLPAGVTSGGADWRTKLKQFLGGVFLPAFSNIETTFESLVADGEYVAGRWKRSLIHRGPFLGVPATGRQLRVSGCTIVRLRGTQIVEQWETQNTLDLYKGIGLPSPVGALETGDAGADRKKVVSHLLEALRNDTPARVHQLLAPDFVNHDLLDGQRAGADGLLQLASDLRHALAHLNVQIDLLVSGDDGLVFARTTFSGRHRNPLFGIPPSDRQVSVSAIEVFGVRGGQVAARWGQLNLLGFASEVGALKLPTDTSAPAPAAGGTGT